MIMIQFRDQQEINKTTYAGILLKVMENMIKLAPKPN